MYLGVGVRVSLRVSLSRGEGGSDESQVVERVGMWGAIGAH